MKRQLTSFRIIIFGFLAVIIVGSFLLMLPMATVDRKGASFVEAIFTSTSACCVTGLVVVPTFSHWSLFGKMVILFLIQLNIYLLIPRYNTFYKNHNRNK